MREIDSQTEPFSKQKRLTGALALRGRVGARRHGIGALARMVLGGCLALLAAGLSAAPARADFRLCNNTGSRVGVAIGYKEGEGWLTEGWWNLSSRSCETIVRGTLGSRFYYIYAVDYDRGGEWSGKAFMCTREKEFTIRGTGDCLARGHERTGFFEVDTGEQAAWTVQLTESTDQAPTRPLQPVPQVPDEAARRNQSSSAPAPTPSGNTR